MNNKIVLETVSWGTMRKEDLIPSFVQELFRIDPDNEVANNVQGTYSDYSDDDIDDYWNSESSDFDLNDLFDEINNVCDLPYVYFGANDGDGSDYGFWADIISLEEDIENDKIGYITNIDDLHDKYLDFTGLLVWDITTSYSLYEAENGRLKNLIWSA